MSRPLIIVGASIALLAAALADFFGTRPGEEKQRLERAQSELAAAQTELASLRVDAAALKEARAEIARLSDALTEARRARSEMAALKKAEAPSKPAANAPSPPAAGGFSGKTFRKMMDSPGMREVVKNQQKAQVGTSYAGLIDQLGLSDEEKETFKDLIGDAMTKKSELGLKLMDESLTPEQKQAIQTEMKAAGDASDAAIRTFLNDDTDYQAFQSWQETLPERTEMNMIGRSIFASSEEPLTPDQEEQLIGLMANARKSVSTSGGAGSQAGFDPGAFTPEGMKQTLQQYDAQAQMVAQGAASVLSPAQLETLAKMQSQIRSMTETSLQMSAAMFGGPPAK